MKTGGVVQPNIIPLNAAAENRVIPRTCGADEFVGVERGADVSQLTMIVSVRCPIVPFVARAGKGANLRQRGDRRADIGAVYLPIGSAVQVARYPFTIYFFF